MKVLNHFVLGVKAMFVCASPRFFTSRSVRNGLIHIMCVSLRYTCQVVMGERHFPIMSADSRQEAREQAIKATMVLLLGEDEMQMREEERQMREEEREEERQMREEEREEERQMREEEREEERQMREEERQSAQVHTHSYSCTHTHLHTHSLTYTSSLMFTAVQQQQLLLLTDAC